MAVPPSGGLFQAAFQGEHHNASQVTSYAGTGAVPVSVLDCVALGWVDCLSSLCVHGMDQVLPLVNVAALWQHRNLVSA